MRDLRRNMQTIAYRLFLGTAELMDEYENPNGSYKPLYSEKITMRISVSPNKGDYSVQQFGNHLDYDRTMITSNTDCPISETTRVYIGADVYEVKAVARSLNAVQYAIKRVDITEKD